jgi:methanol--5-hydroxybenzimidazolylcobamide Co-methyltransferase
MVRLFESAGTAGADLLSIESTGGKEIFDDALVRADLEGIVFALGVLAPRDMRFLWGELVRSAAASDVLPAGDSACAFANTAMVLANKRFLPRVLAAVVRVASVPRSLVAIDCGAVGPSKDCAYEGPYLKAIAGIPISMEGRSAACAHLSPVGNVSQAVCDAWSNESVQNVRLLSDIAPVVSLEQLAYDCRLMNTASASSRGDALRLRDWLADSDAVLDPQAFVLHPEVVLRLSACIASEPTPYLQTRRAILSVLDELRRADLAGEVRVPPKERAWLSRLSSEADRLPEDEEAFIGGVLPKFAAAPYLPSEYGLPA